MAGNPTMAPGEVALARISPEALDLGEHLDAVAGSGFGAVVTFIGQIRDHDPDASGPVERLEYSAHPDAERILASVAATEILDYVRNHGAIDLIVIATGGRGAVSRLMLGSVTDKIVRKAPCPVLTVHPHDREDTVGTPRAA